MFYPSPLPIALPSGNQVWAADAVPSGATVLMPFQLGDYLWITLATAGLPFLYKCITAPSSSNFDGVWQAEGSQAVKTVSAAYTALSTDSTIIQTNASGVAVTLPAASTVKGKTFTIKNGGGTASTSNTVVATAIDAGTTVTLTAAASSVMIRSDGTQYWVVAAFGTNTVG